MFRDYQAAFEKATGLPLSLHPAEHHSMGSMDQPAIGSPFCALMARTNRACEACAGAPSPPVDLSVFLAYENLASALFATETLTALSRRDPDGLIVQLSPWSFAALVDPLRRALATPDVGQAHLVVIAGGGALAPLPAPMVKWLKSCLVQRGNDRPAVVALFTHSYRSGRMESLRRRSVEHLAQETGCAFFSPGAAGELGNLV